MQFQALLVAALAADAGAARCKTIPGSPDWPSIAQWSALNESISGNLLHPAPPFASCHINQPEFNVYDCAIKMTQVTNSSFYASDPVGVDYNDLGCVADARYPCNRTQYPTYVVAAKNAHHVKAGIDFARENNLRLVVKGTGHDFPGRSIAANSFSIWTHGIRGITFHDNFKPQNCDDCFPHSAVTIGAGFQMRDIQLEASKRKVVVVGGSDPNVGVGGFLASGGHSPISSTYGLGADQALEFEVVTADGDILVVNEVDHPDLFWALRGGGGSTYGVMTSVTVKTFPTPPLGLVVYQFSTAPSEAFWDFTTYFHTKLPDMNDAGLMGYFFASPTSLQGPENTAIASFSGIFIAPDRTTQQVKSAFKDVSDYASSLGMKSDVKYYAVPDFYSYWRTNSAQTVGSTSRLASRLIGREALTGNKTFLKEMLKQSTPPPWTLLGHVVAGRGVEKVVPAGGSDSVLPAWRKAIVHLVTPTSWPPFDHKTKHLALEQLAHRVQALVDLDPDSGAYVNEADPDTRSWQNDFWGSNYDRLLEIKRKYDPTELFYCKSCVGSEGWVEEQGKLCKH